MALLGYVLHKARLFALSPQWQGMSVLTAIAVLCIATVLWPKRQEFSFPLHALNIGLAVMLLLAVLGSHLVFGQDVISPWISDGVLGISAGSSGRVSVATAVALLSLGIAAVVVRSGIGSRVRIVEVCANFALLIGATATLGYAYRISDLYVIYLFNTMSLQSALSIVSLALASLITVPQTRLGMALRSTSLNVRQQRRLLTLTAMPPVAGWLLLHAGTPLSNGNSAAMALLVTVTGIPMYYLVLEVAHSMELLDRERHAQHEIEQRVTDDLRTRLDAQTAELVESHRLNVEALSQGERNKRFEMIAQLTGGIAHDFNNLLMIISGNAQLLKMRMRGDPSALPFVERIAATVTGAARLTGQLSAFSRTQRLDTTPFPIDAIVRAAIEDCKLDCGVNIVSSVRLGAPDSIVRGDSAQFQLALTHIIRNACESMDEGGTLSVTSAPQQARERQSVRIEVTDTGVGMTSDQLGRALEPFYTTKRGNHLGLGLAQANSVVSQASGTLHLSSQVGTGTSVELILPCVEPPAVRMPVDERRSTQEPPTNQRLLVIDDDDEVRTVIVALLRQMEYDVVEANGGKAGLELLRRQMPSLAIIDYLMPDMNGAEVARRVRQQAPDLPIVFISGYSDSEAIAAIPYSRVLRKPVAAEELAQAVASALQVIDLM